MRKLYRYRKFNSNTVKELCGGTFYYATPKRLNDPFECSPMIDIDMEHAEFKGLCANALTLELGKDLAETIIRNIELNASDPILNILSKNDMLSDALLRALHSRLKNNGIIAFSERNDSILMWSHYAEEHKGVCIEYTIQDDEKRHPTQIDYNGERAIPATVIYDFFSTQSEASKERIYQSYFFTKAQDWSYEKEWRIVGESSNKEEYANNSQPALYDISAVYFGMNCDSHIIGTIVKLMDNREFPVSFHKMWSSKDSFDLKHYPIDVEETLHRFPMRTACQVFKNVGDN